MGEKRPFRFFECFVLTTLTGRRASTVVELVEILKTISPESIFHHMHQYFLKPHLVVPEFTNDFAVWASQHLREPLLAEALANVNPFEFSNIEELRAELLAIMERYISSCPRSVPVPRDREFMFNEGITLVIPTGMEALQMHDFVQKLKEVDASSVYFHFFESRLRLGRPVDDFSEFLATTLQRPEVASRIKSLDPYMYSTGTLRDKIVKIIEEAL